MTIYDWLLFHPIIIIVNDINGNTRSCELGSWIIVASPTREQNRIIEGLLVYDNSTKTKRTAYIVWKTSLVTAEHNHSCGSGVLTFEEKRFKIPIRF
jgi:hypothetical protein